MKTFEELEEAMRILTEEANNSECTFCAAITPPISGPVTSMHCGESLKLLGMAEVIKINVIKRIQVDD